MQLSHIIGPYMLLFTLFHQMNGSTNKTYTQEKHDNEQNTSNIYSTKH